MQRRIIQTCLLLVFLAACGIEIPTTVPLPTLYQTPTATVQPAVMTAEMVTSSPTFTTTMSVPEITIAPEGTSTFEPIITTTLPPLPTPSFLPTLTATGIPQPVEGSAAIQIYYPGPLSKLVSPLLLYGYAVPGYGYKGTASLYGEDGRILDLELLQLNTANKWAYFNWRLDFKVQGAGELGRLSLSTQDEYTRVTAVNSIHLLLLPEGFSIVNPPGDFKEHCVIEQPAVGHRISGGSLFVAGDMRPFNNLPLVVELVDRAGNVLAAQPVSISPAPDNNYLPFQVTLAYSIPKGTWARLTIYQPDDRIPGTMYLSSREVFLNP
jgi:hypothetical protein